ncbi:START domain-containing protein 10-like [Ptychodera flava]|uniref:START domain-containing protein 10-like n=1 Tax=Ptychodera flava TaxID=63121 RepID=UPI003969CDBC
MPIGVGEVRIPDDEDFREFIKLAEDQEGWSQQYAKSGGTTVWTREGSSSAIKMFKVYRYFPDINAEVMYDVLHDGDYRPLWDKAMIEGKEVCLLNPNNDIGYYALKCPSPIKNRDFVLQRTWLETSTEYVIFNHSIFHKDLPPKKGYVRAESQVTGYLIRPKPKGCEMTYVSQSDPKGSLPKWLVNKVTQIIAPKIMQRVYKACLKYPSWKAKNNPNHKPWLYPEQNTLPRLKLDDILQRADYSTESLDESELQEDEFKVADLDLED